MAKKKRISVAAAKAKGRRLQQLVGRKLSELTGIPFGKDEMIASREMGQSGTDVRLIGRAKKLIKLSIECKYQEKWSVHQWIQQAKENQDPDTEWLLVCKRNHMSPVVILDLEVFLTYFHQMIRIRKLNKLKKFVKKKKGK